MVCLGLKPGAAEWLAQRNPLSYGGTPIYKRVLFWYLQLNNKAKHWYSSSKNMYGTVPYFENGLVFQKAQQLLAIVIGIIGGCFQ